MWVKICGTTNLDDALLTAKLGADAIGFVFAPSVRQVTAEQVAAIAPHLPSHIERVGVFPAWSAKKITDAVHESGLTAVQLHGEFDPGLVSSLRLNLPPEMMLIQALHWTVGPQSPDAITAEDKLQQIVDCDEIGRVLVDSKVGAATGGTGVPFDWNTARSLFALHPRLILAGGLKPQNVGDAVKTLRPWGVDVASGVEAVAGRKDPEKLKQFIAEARRS